MKARETRSNGGINGPLAFYALNMIRRGKVFDSCIAALREKARLPILKSAISMRNVFPESQLYGAAAKALGTSAGAKEIDAMTDEIFEVLKMSTKKGQK